MAREPLVVLYAVTNDNTSYLPPELPPVVRMIVCLYSVLLYVSILGIGLTFGALLDGVDLSSTGASNGDGLVKGITQR